MIAPTNLHSHLCISCERPHCGCYMEPCPYRSARSENYTCGFCRIGVQGPKPKQDALEQTSSELKSMAISS